MNIEITSRHFTASDHLKALVYEKINKIQKFNNSIINCQVILTKESNNENVEIVVHAKGYNFVASVNSHAFERSLINAIDKISAQIKKQHEKSVSR